MQVLSSRIILHVADLAVARRFYEETLGLSIYREWGVGVAYFLGGGFLELSEGTGTSPASASSGGSRSSSSSSSSFSAGGRGQVGGRSTLWLQLPTLRGVEDELVAAGVPVVKATETMPWGLIELWVLDRDGNELRLVEVPPTHPLRRR